MCFVCECVSRVMRLSGYTREGNAGRLRAKKRQKSSADSMRMRHDDVATKTRYAAGKNASAATNLVISLTLVRNDSCVYHARVINCRAIYYSPLNSPLCR